MQFNYNVIPFWGSFACVGYIVGHGTGAVVGLGAALVISFFMSLVKG